MVVRVYDSSTNTYFKSAVYAIINAGWYERRLVLVPAKTGSYFKLFDYLDKSNPGKLTPITNLVTPRVPDDTRWIHQNSGSIEEHLEHFKGSLSNDVLFFSYSGYPWLLENKSMIVTLLNGDIVPLQGSGCEDKLLDYKVKGFNYVESQEDIDFLMGQTFSFHDSILHEIRYVSGSYVKNDNTMCPIDDIRQVTMVFQSQWCSPIEMVFEGVTALNLRPSTDNYSAEIYSASLFMQDAAVFFCDGDIDKIDLSYEDTWITAYSLRWRFHGQS